LKEIEVSRTSEALTVAVPISENFSIIEQIAGK
jgi:hypothetical protein